MGVIDFGLMGVGDFSVDLIIVWNFLLVFVCVQFCVVVGVVDDDWMCGCGRVLVIVLIVFLYY